MGRGENVKHGDIQKGRRTIAHLPFHLLGHLEPEVGVFYEINGLFSGCQLGAAATAATGEQVE